MRSRVYRSSSRACCFRAAVERRAYDRPPAARASTRPASPTRPARLGGASVPWQYPVHGIDVSKYQGDIDWHRVRASGVSLRLHQGDRGRRPHRRPVPSRTGTRARAAGVPRGAYHFYYFCRPAAEQAAWFMNHVPRDARRAAAGARPGVDPQVQKPAAAFPTPRPCAPRRRCFLQALTAYYGKRPIIYTTVDFYRDNDLGGLQGYPLLAALGGRASVGGLPGPALGLLAIHRHRRRRRHRRPDRHQRLRGVASAVAGVVPGRLTDEARVRSAAMNLSLFDDGPFAPCPAPFNMAAHTLATALHAPSKVALEVLSAPGTVAVRRTFSEIAAAVRATAGGLAARGLGRGDRVAVAHRQHRGLPHPLLRRQRPRRRAGPDLVPAHRGRSRQRSSPTSRPR